MQKKVRILMVLLCLFMFPLKVFALEEAISETGYASNDEVAEINNISSDAEESLDTTVDDVEEFDYSQIEGQVHAYDEEEQEDLEQDVEDTDPAVVLIDKINLVDVITEFAGGDTPTFNGKAIAEDQDKYSIEYEVWYDTNGYSETYHYSVDSMNDQYSFATYRNISAYVYGFAISVKDGYKLPETNGRVIDFPVSINGVDYQYAHFYESSMGDKTVYVFTPYLSRIATSDDEIIEQVIINDINSNITVGKKPSYTATVDPSLEGKITIGNECWYYNDFSSGDYPFYINYKDPSFKAVDETLFTNFVSNKTYNYAIFFTLEDGYNLKVDFNEYGNPSYKVLLNGVETTAYYYTSEYNGKEYFGVYGSYYKNAEEESYTVNEGANTTLTNEDNGDLTIGVDTDATIKYVIVDNKVLHDGYSIVDGKIVFTNDFLKSLSNGYHQVIITYTDGMSAYTSITIEEVIEEVVEETIKAPIATATSNRVVTNSYTNEEESDTTLEEKEEKKSNEVVKEDKKEEKKKAKKPEKESLTKTNSTFYIILVVLFLIIIAVPFVIDRKKQ